MTNSQNEPSASPAIGCYVAAMYVLYWPAVYAARAGSAWHASRHPGFTGDWGDPEFWALAWLLAPITTPFMLFVATIYWVVGPVIDVVVRVFW